MKLFGLFKRTKEPDPAAKPEGTGVEEGFERRIPELAQFYEDLSEAETVDIRDEARVCASAL